MKVGEIYGKNRNKKLLVMYIDFFLMTLFGGIYNIYTSKNYGIKEQVNTIANRYNKWLYLFHISSC